MTVKYPAGTPHKTRQAEPAPATQPPPADTPGGKAKVPLVDGVVKPPTKNKFGNHKVIIDGIKFDSKKEAGRYVHLIALQSAGEISELRWQVTYAMVINGQKVCKYIADFVYLDASGAEIVEDVKSYFTRKNLYYRLKKKLMFAVHGITITEI